MDYTRTFPKQHLLKDKDIARVKIIAIDRFT
jgi:hypothetical protein